MNANRLKATRLETTQLWEYWPLIEVSLYTGDNGISCGRTMA